MKHQESNAFETILFEPPVCMCMFYAKERQCYVTLCYVFYRIINMCSFCHS